LALLNSSLTTVIAAKYAGHEAEEHTSYVAYTIQNFVADCGGLIGLFLGLSLLSIFELVCDAVVMCVKVRKSRRVADTIIRKSTQNRCFKLAHKLLWLVAIIFSICGLAFYTHVAYTKWHIQPDIATTVKQIPSSQIPLPAITICSSMFPNQIQMGVSPLPIMNDAISGELYPNLTAEQQNYLAVVMQTCCTKHFIIGARKVCTNRSETNVIKLLKEAKILSQFTSCSFRDKKVDCDRIVKPSLTEHGICHTFNMG
jgi:hypothetical protein